MVTGPMCIYFSEETGCMNNKRRRFFGLFQNPYCTFRNALECCTHDEYIANMKIIESQEK